MGDRLREGRIDTGGGEGQTQRWGHSSGRGQRLGDRRCLRQRMSMPWTGVEGTAFPSLCPPPSLPDYDERSHLHDAFTQMTHSLQEIAAAQGEWGGDGLVHVG